MIPDIFALLASQLKLPKERIVPEARLVEDLGADSLDLVRLTMVLEDDFGLRVTDEELETVKTVADVVRICGKAEK